MNSAEQLSALVQTNLPDNNRQQITAQRMRETLLPIIEYISNLAPEYDDSELRQLLADLEAELQQVLTSYRQLSNNDFGGAQLVDVADGTEPGHAVTKRQLDALVQGLTPEQVNALIDAALVIALADYRLRTNNDFDGAQLVDIADGTAANHAVTKGQLDAAIAGLVNGAPGILDTLNELAAALDVKFNNPINVGSIGQVVTKTVSGSEWANLPPSTDDAIDYTPADTNNTTGFFAPLLDVDGKLKLRAALNRNVERVQTLINNAISWLSTTPSTLVYRNSSGVVTQGQVPTDVIANTAITQAKLANNSVGTNQIINVNVTTAKIANDAVDNTKLANMPAQTVKGNANATATDPQDLPLVDGLNRNTWWTDFLGQNAWAPMGLYHQITAVTKSDTPESTLINTTNAIGSRTITGLYVQAGMLIGVRMVATLSVTTAYTLTIRFKIGSITIASATIALVIGANSLIADFQLSIQQLNVVDGTFAGGLVHVGGANLIVPIVFNTGQNINWDNNQSVDVTAELSATTGSITLQQINMRREF